MKYKILSALEILFLVEDTGDIATSDAECDIRMFIVNSNNINMLSCNFFEKNSLYETYSKWFSDQPIIFES